MDTYMGTTTTGDNNLLDEWLADADDFLESSGADLSSTPTTNDTSPHPGGAGHHPGGAAPAHPGGAAPAHPGGAAPELPVPDNYESDDDLGAPLELAPAAMRARIQGAGTVQGTPCRTHFSVWRERALGLAPIPSPIMPDGTENRIGLAQISKGEGLEETPWPDPEHLVCLEGRTLTSIVLAHPEHFAPHGLDETFLTKCRTDLGKHSVLADELGLDNRAHPDTNPQGFPSDVDRSVTCHDFMLLRNGETTGCHRWCRTFVTRHPPRQHKPALGCGLRSCVGFRAANHPDKDKGAPGMLLVGKFLSSLIAEELFKSQHRDYESRLQRCSNLLLRHSTLLVGQLRYEAYVASKENAAELAHTPSGRGRGRGGRGRGRGRGRDRDDRSRSSQPRIGESLNPRQREQARGARGAQQDPHTPAAQTPLPLASDVPWSATTQRGRGRGRATSTPNGAGGMTPRDRADFEEFCRLRRDNTRDNTGRRGGSSSSRR